MSEQFKTVFNKDNNGFTQVSANILKYLLFRMQFKIKIKEISLAVAHTSSEYDNH